MRCANPYFLEASGDRRFFIGCGQCLHCRIKKRREWTMRILHEQLYHEESCFITLTYDDEHLPARGLSKRHLQLFFKRLRKQHPGQYKYYACGEYGDRFDRAHYHAVILGLSEEKARIALPQIWPFGITDVGDVTADSIRYVAQYIDKKYFDDQDYDHFGADLKPFQLQSAGIGRQYAIDNIETLIDERHYLFKGKFTGIPRYYLKVCEKVRPDLYEKYSKQLALEGKTKHADEMLELCEKTGGVSYYDLTPWMKNYILYQKAKRGKAANANLAAKAKINALKKGVKDAS